MSTRLVVDSHNQLEEEIIADRPPESPAVRLVANIISYIFHPVFVPVYMVIFLLYVHPYIFLGFSGFEKSRVLIHAVLLYSFFPLVTVFLLKALAFIPTVFLKTQKERFIPLIAVMTCSFWTWNVWRNLPEYPKEAVLLALSVFLATIVAWLMNIYMKVSLHAISAGVLVAYSLRLGLSDSVNPGIYISVAFLVAGLICTARLIASDHRLVEVYGGLLGGMLAVPVASYFI